MIVRVSVRIVVTEYEPGLCRECVDVHNGQRLSITLEAALTRSELRLRGDPVGEGANRHGHLLWPSRHELTAGYVSLAGSPLTPLDCGLG